MSYREAAFMIVASVILPVFVYGMIVASMFGSIIQQPAGALAIFSIVFLPIYGAFVAYMTWDTTKS